MMDINEATIRYGFSELERLARLEYRESLVTVVGDPDDERSAVRVGRLIGVLLKKPFAVESCREQPSSRTKAYRSWDLVGKGEFEDLSRTPRWQSRALGEIRVELISEEPYLEEYTAYDFAFLAHNETGFFGYFARAVRKYICGDKAIGKKVEDALKEFAREGEWRALTPDVIMRNGGLTLGVYLVSAIPLMGMVDAPVIAGLVIILYKLGIKAFCEWSDNLRTDEDEKH